eukprot:6519761-Lingulodinium_polyedra.AAC.1
MSSSAGGSAKTELAGGMPSGTRSRRKNRKTWHASLFSRVMAWVCTWLCGAMPRGSKKDFQSYNAPSWVTRMGRFPLAPPTLSMTAWKSS